MKSISELIAIIELSGSRNIRTSLLYFSAIHGSGIAGTIRKAYATNSTSADVLRELWVSFKSGHVSVLVRSEFSGLGGMEQVQKALRQGVQKGLWNLPSSHLWQFIDQLSADAVDSVDNCVLRENPELTQRRIEWGTFGTYNPPFLVKLG